MPESVTDRPTKSHEYLFLLAKSERYFYDSEAIREPAGRASEAKWDNGLDGHGGGLSHRGQGSSTRKFSSRPYTSGQKERTLDGAGRPPDHLGTGVPWTDTGIGRNKRSVWSINTQPFLEAHFATFPEALIEPCILAGTSERGACSACGAPWRRVVERKGGTIGQSWHDHSADAERGQRIADATTKGMQDKSHGRNGHEPYSVTTTGWQATCACAAPTRQPLVLDPFSGSGTVDLVCNRLGRRGIGLELSPVYCAMAYRRSAQLGLV